MLALLAQETVEENPEKNCALFDSMRDKAAKGGPNGSFIKRTSLSNLTAEITRQLAPAFVPGGTRTNTELQLDKLGTIDHYIFQAIQEAGVVPADRTTDAEYIRRVTLDLTGRIPDPARVLSFLADTRENRRQLLVDELLAKPEWIDKWTMYFGDLFKNVSRNTQIPRYPEGTQAFYNWIRASLTANKPYNQIAAELIGASGKNSYTQGELNFVVGGVITGGPVQDVWDGQTVLAVSTFLGISHINCLLCHNGRGHLDALSLWGKSTTRAQAWQMSSFFSHTDSNRTPVDAAAGGTPYYWSLEDNTRYTLDYQLSTTTGNRPARSGNTRVAPMYLFSGRGPKPGENYRVAFARELTGDFQFARAAVNYMWEQFFGKGMVDPSDGFDPARLDPDNPPEDGWSLQPSNARLLNALAQDFVNSKYDLKALMKEIVTSEAYMLSSRYNGTWNPQWEKLYARKFVRRLWAEEIHDAVAQSSGLLPTYDLTRLGFSNLTVQFAMKLPEPTRTPDGGAVSNFLDNFLRGNRDDEDRKDDGSISQALDLMNDNFVMTRIRGTGNANLLLVKNINLPNDQLAANLFLAVLSRYPTEKEKSSAVAQLQNGARVSAAEDLLWSLYNKVDFIFNY